MGKCCSLALLLSPGPSPHQPALTSISFHLANVVFGPTDILRCCLDGLAGFPDIHHVGESNNVEVVVLVEVTEYDMHRLLGLEGKGQKGQH